MPMNMDVLGIKRPVHGRLKEVISSASSMPMNMDVLGMKRHVN
jgi:hypothetical protein